MPRSLAPPGWSLNPSAWDQRAPILALAVLGFLIAGYMALFQLGVLGAVQDPLTAEGTRRVLTSPLSRALPVPDAALGALAYLADAVLGSIGGKERWRRMPWIVLAFGVVVGPLGLVSVLLVIAQPLTVGAWCALCLATAVISVLMIGPAMDEVLATLQHLRSEQRAGRSVMRALLGREGAARPPAGAEASR